MTSRWTQSDPERSMDRSADAISEKSADKIEGAMMGWFIDG
jgi:hypothetical protein